MAVVLKKGGVCVPKNLNDLTHHIMVDIDTQYMNKAPPSYNDNAIEFLKESYYEWQN